MKTDWKKLIALVMGAILMLSLAGLSEKDVVIEDGATVNEEPVAKLDILDLPLAGADLEALEIDEAIDDGEVISNALVKKVSIGVKEKYTIDTSSLIGKLTFVTADKKTATVNKKGIVVGKKVGSTKITIVDGQGKKHKITVVVAKAPNEVTLKKKKATLEIGDTLKLRAKLPNKTASNKLTWKSSNKRVATVSAMGEVEAIAAGTATITVKTFNGKKATCQVTVKAYEPEPTPVPTVEQTPTPTPTPTATPTPAPTPTESMPEGTIGLCIGGSVFTAKLVDNATARAFEGLLPMTLNMSELNGNEKYHYLDGSLPSEPENVGQINAGDLMLYGDDCVVLFYKSFSTRYSYTRIGHINDISGLESAVGSGSVQVRFTK